MKQYVTLSLIVIFMTTFTLFLGWIHIGVIIPQFALLIATFIFCPDVTKSKSAVWFYIFFIYQICSSIYFEEKNDVVVLLAKFMGMALPIYISTFLFSTNCSLNYKRISKYVLATALITILLSIRILLFEGEALRLSSMANSTGDWDKLYGYWRQGMADYSMAAMMMFMPLVLISSAKNSKDIKLRRLFFVGAAIALLFLYLGQVTAPFLLCILFTFFAFFSKYNSTRIIIGTVILFVTVSFFMGDLINLAIGHTENSAMNEKFVAFSQMSKGEVVDESSGAGIRIALLTDTFKTILGNPIFGNLHGAIGGHNFFLDQIALYGFVGSFPLFMFIIEQYKLISRKLEGNSKEVFKLIMIGFILYGFIKNMSGIEYWTYFFIYYPCILAWHQNEFKKY